MSKDEAMGRAYRHADDEWKAKAVKVVRRLAYTMEEFTTDDVWTVLDASGYATHERRAIGPIMKKAQGMGLVKPTGRFVISRRPVCNKRPVMVWKSAVDE